MSVVGASLACTRSTPTPMLPARTGSNSSAKSQSSAASSASSSASIDPPATIASSSAPPAPKGIERIEWKFPDEYGGPKQAVVLLPQKPRSEPLPILIALHGMGETITPETGARGWPTIYQLERTMSRMFCPPLTKEDFGNLVTDQRLAQVNLELEKQPFQGMAVLCPYVPATLWQPNIEGYAKWLTERLLVRARSELPVSKLVRATGIDGVSLGGWAALHIGITHPEAFYSLGTLQAAVSDYGNVDNYAWLIRQNLKGRPLHIVTSTYDNYRWSLSQLDAELTQMKIAHDFLLTEGPHDYPWNKGPGGIEMLLWHDRHLRAT
jgi:enterochelin esterase-like enzyme